MAIIVNSWDDIINTYKENPEKFHSSFIPVKYAIQLYEQVQELSKQIEELKVNK